MINFICEAQLIGSPETGSKHGQLILLQSVYMHFKFLISAPTPQKYEFQKMRVNTWQQIRGNWGKFWQSSQGRSHERTVFISILPFSVEARMVNRPVRQKQQQQQQHRGQSWTMNCFPAPTLLGVAEWGQLMGRANSNILQFIHDWQKTMFHHIKIKTWLMAVFPCSILPVGITVWVEGDQSVLPTVLRLPS
jgi:hypothetical protein